VRRRRDPACPLPHPLRSARGRAPLTSVKVPFGKRDRRESDPQPADPRPQPAQPGESDADLNMMWGDCGVLYWMARPEDLVRGDLTRTSFTWQCG
jgi:hypothetical protein